MPQAPATSAPGVSGQDLPTGEKVGTGWRAVPEADDPEENIVSNGTPYAVREPATVVAALVPQGCPNLSDPEALPTPTTALQATYRSRSGIPGVGVVLNYGTDVAAQRAFDLYSRQARTCSNGRAKPQSADQTAISILVSTPTRLVTQRVDATLWAGSRTWTEAAARVGAQLRLLSVNTAPARAGNLLSDRRLLAN